MNYLKHMTENWVHHILTNNKTVLQALFTDVLKYEDYDFFDFVLTIKGEIFCSLGP